MVELEQVRLPVAVGIDHPQVGPTVVVGVGDYEVDALVATGLHGFVVGHNVLSGWRDLPTVGPSSHPGDPKPVRHAVDYRPGSLRAWLRDRTRRPGRGRIRSRRRSRRGPPVWIRS